MKINKLCCKKCAKVITNAFGGQVIYIPKFDKTDYSDILKMHRVGVKIRIIAKAFDLSERRVYQIIRK